MSPRALLRLGVRSLLLHKLRSGLSILGVVFGVAAVVAMSSVGEGARREAMAQIGALGIDTITVRAKQGLAPGVRPACACATPRHWARWCRGWWRWRPVREEALSVEMGSRHADAVLVGTEPGVRATRRASPRPSGRFLAPISTCRTASAWRCWGRRWPAPSSPSAIPRGERVFVGGD